MSEYPTISVSVYRNAKRQRRSLPGSALAGHDTVLTRGWHEPPKHWRAVYDALVTPDETRQLYTVCWERYEVREPGIDPVTGLRGSYHVRFGWRCRNRIVANEYFEEVTGV